MRETKLESKGAVWSPGAGSISLPPLGANSLATRNVKAQNECRGIKEYSSSLVYMCESKLADTYCCHTKKTKNKKKQSKKKLLQNHIM